MRPGLSLAGLPITPVEIQGRRVSGHKVVAGYQSQESAETMDAAYTAIETNLTKAADQMSDANYSFKATPDVRTFGATIAHIADVQMRTCSAVKGEQKQADAASKTAKVVSCNCEGVSTMMVS